MSKPVAKKGVKKKYSIFNPSPKLLKTLKEIYQNDSGTVTYVFCTERVDLSDPNFPNGKDIIVKTNQCSPLNRQMFFKEIKGVTVKRTPQEVLEVLDSIRWDLGASYFIVNS